MQLRCKCGGVKCKMSAVGILKVGRSFYFRLPVDWRREHGIDRGSLVNWRELEDGSIIISPKQVVK